MSSAHLTNEEKLVLALLRLLITRKKGSPQILSEYFARIDSEVFKKCVERNGISGIIYASFGKEPDIPAVIGDFKKNYRSIAFRNFKQLTELLNILDFFQENTIAVVPLKGVVDSERIFGGLGIYPSSDIDLLVSPSQLDVVEKVLNKNEYFSVEEISKADLLASHYHLVFRKKLANIEVHWNLVKRYFKIPADFWWEGVNPFTYENRKILELAPEKYLLYLVFRLFDHQFAPLKFWVHLSAFITSSQKLDFEILEMYSRQFGMHILVRFVLKFAADLFQANMPLEHTDRKIFGYNFLKGLVLEQNFQENTTPHRSMFLFTCFLLPPAKALPLSFLRSFPPKSEIRLRYNIPLNSPKVYLYLLLNPILLIFRRK